jgi:hypothetical protein
MKWTSASLRPRACSLARSDGYEGVVRRGGGPRAAMTLPPGGKSSGRARHMEENRRHCGDMLKITTSSGGGRRGNPIPGEESLYGSRMRERCEDNVSFFSFFPKVVPLVAFYSNSKQRQRQGQVPVHFPTKKLRKLSRIGP